MRDHCAIRKKALKKAGRKELLMSSLPNSKLPSVERNFSHLVEGKGIKSRP